MHTLPRHQLRGLGQRFHSLRWHLDESGPVTQWCKGHFTHETESPWPLHFKHSYWWKRRSWSKFAASHSAWGTNWVYKWMQDGCKNLHGFLHGIEWTMFHGHLDYSQRLPLGGRSKLGDHGTPNAHNCWFILFYRVWGPAWIKNSLK
jgi:hypothetical protein